MTRIAEIYLRREQGVTFQSIATDYGISRDRARQIYLAEKIKKDRVSVFPKDNPQKPEESELYFLIINSRPMGFEEMTIKSRSRAYNALKRDWINRTGYRDSWPPVQFLAALSEDEIAHLRGIGQLLLSFILALKAELPEMMILPEHKPAYEDSLDMRERPMLLKGVQTDVSEREKATELYQLLYKHSPSFKKTLVSVKWTYDCLRRGWREVYGIDAGVPTVDYLMALSEENIRKLPNAGESVALFLLDIKRVEGRKRKKQLK